MGPIVHDVAYLDLINTIYENNPLDINDTHPLLSLDILNNRNCCSDRIDNEPCCLNEIDCCLRRRHINITRHCKGCSFYNTDNIYNRLQTQKRIQNVVRIPSSLYQDNLSALNVYEKPIYINQTNHNQSSDRIQYHIQRVVVPSHCNTLRSTKTSCKPGAGSPGGVGVDVKHNSYARYLNRIKGKGPYRRGPIPREQMLRFVPFNPAFPVYGDKFVKLNIIDRCNCLI
jgi:hypothetical protein